MSYGNALKNYWGSVQTFGYDSVIAYAETGKKPFAGEYSAETFLMVVQLKSGITFDN